MESSAPNNVNLRTDNGGAVEHAGTYELLKRLEASWYFVILHVSIRMHIKRKAAVRDEGTVEALGSIDDPVGGRFNSRAS